MPKRVLLIEYEPRYVERIRALLTPLGHAISEAHDGEAGIQAFGNSRFDLILLSGILPRLPSAEVIREIRKKGGATAPPIILMMTGYRGSNRKADAQKVGAFDILMRPFSDEDLMGAVRDAIDSTDVGAKTMRIDTAQVPGASPLTSSDIFSELLDELKTDAASKKRPSTPPAAPAPEPPPPAFAVPPSHPPAARAAGESDMDKRLRDTLSGLMPSKPAAAPRAPSDRTPPPAVAAPTPPAPRPRLSSDTDVDRMIEDTLSGLSRPKARPAGSTPPPASAQAPRKREEPAAAVPSSGPDHFGQYEILERIAAGGMAELYKAKRTGVEGFQKIVAIKKILPHLADDEAFVTMFADEAKLAAQLNHPNIIHIYDLGKIQAGGYFIAMEYVDGRDLRAIQQSGRDLGVPLPVPLAVYVASKVASALDYAHRRRDADGHELNIVHRDVSPQNILISYEGDIKLCDFGIAKAASKASKTQSGALKGKIQYMSPEQAWGRPIDRRSDLFSLGVVLHELLTGERLFGGDTDINVLEKVRSAEVVPPSQSNPEVPQNLDAVVLKALAKEPDDRYANASDLLRDLDSVLYSYTPAPGSADVAIYLHRLQAEEGAVAEAKAREAAQAVEEAEPAARKRKSKGAPISRKTPPAPRPAAPAAPPSPPAPRPPAAAPPEPARPAPEVFGSIERTAEAEKASRAPLILGVAAAAVVLVGFLAWRMSRPQSAKPILAPTAAAAVPTAAPTVAVAAAVVPTAAPAVDQKAVEAEVQRQLAAKRKELERTAAAGKSAAAAAAAAPAEPAPAQAAPAPQLAEPTALPTLPPTPVPVPTAAPTEPPLAEVARSVPPPAREPEVQRGDLIGPGTGVMEPVLVAPPRIVYPPIARQQRVEGKVVVLVLVDENGHVADTKLQQGVSQGAVNDAVMAGVKQAKFRAATKNGIPVKMWRPIIVEVKP
jgi:TonB family protein